MVEDSGVKCMIYGMFVERHLEAIDDIVGEIWEGELDKDDWKWVDEHMEALKRDIHLSKQCGLNPENMYGAATSGSLAEQLERLEKAVKERRGYLKVTNTINDIHSIIDAQLRP